MTDSPEQISEKIENPEESLPDLEPVVRVSEGEKKQEHERYQEAKEEQLEELKEKIENIIEEDLPEKEDSDSKKREEKIEAYQKRYIPDYLLKKAKGISKLIINFIASRSKCETEIKEELPETGPFLVVCNHFGGGDVEAILKTFKDFDVHFGIAKGIWWDSSPIIRWFLKKLRTIPIEESLSNLSEDQKEESLKKQNWWGKKIFRKIINREKETNKFSRSNLEAVQQMVAVLSRGDVVAIFPEGLWLNPEGSGFDPREKAEMKQGYPGIELIAKQYKKLTGKDLLVIATALAEDKSKGTKKFVVAKKLQLDDNNTDLSPVDWCMAHVAKSLPEEQRGYYKEMVEKI